MSRMKVEKEEEISIASIIDTEEEVQEEESFKHLQLRVILGFWGVGILMGFLIGVLIYG